jgi:hypothetical protein
MNELHSAKKIILTKKMLNADFFICLCRNSKLIKMKKIFCIILTLIFPLVILAQEGIKTDYGSMNELNSDDQNLIIPAGIKYSSEPEIALEDTTFVKLVVFLEGPFDKGKMNTELNKNNLIPLSQPFNVPPWNYSGNESVSEIPNVNVVDWILVDVRTADSAGAATSATIFAQKAGFIMNNGSICNPDGSTLLSFDTVFS